MATPYASAHILNFRQAEALPVTAYETKACTAHILKEHRHAIARTP